MSWITFIWSLTAGICLTLGAVHFLVWIRRREDWASLVFTIAAAAAAGYAILDMVALRDQTAAEYGELWRWALALGMLEGPLIVWFTRLYLKAGRLWLLWLICGLRGLMLVLNFVAGPNFYYREITDLHRTPLLGELISRPHGELHPWVILMPLSFVLIIVFAIDAAHTASKRSGRRDPWVLGGLTACGFSAGLVSYALYAREILPTTFSSQLVLSLVILMGYELSRDVLRAAQLANELRESEQRMTLAAEAAGFGIWMWNVARNQVWASERWLSLFGFPSGADLSFETVIQRIHPEDREFVEAAVRLAIKDGVPYAGEYRVVLPDGTERWISARGRMFGDGNSKAARMLGASLDISGRKRDERALRESEARFRTVADTAPVLIWMSGSDKLRNFFNKVWLDFTGRTLEQELGNGWAEGVHPDDLAECLKTYVESFDARRPFTMEYRLRRRDGEYRWLSDNGVPRYDSMGNFLGYIGSCGDLTERKQAEAELARQRNELSHLSRVTTMSELSSSLAHELNQPLAIILTNAQAAQRLLAQEPPDVAETRDILADIVSEDERAGEVIRRLRALLKPGQIQRVPLALDEIIEDVLRIARSDLIGRGVTVHTALAESAPQVLGDRIQLQQVLLNLILNACDAMAANAPAQRRLTITTAYHDGLLRISVSDTGRGLPAETERIFQPFYTTKEHGLGLGLPICRSIVTAHQGRLWAEARGAPGTSGGATLHLELPAGAEGSN